MDYWSELPPVRDLPVDYRAWAWWLRNGPHRAEGTIGGSAMFRVLRAVRRTLRPGTDRFLTLHAPPRPALTLHLDDFESFHHALPVWFRGDVETTLLRRLLRSGGTYVDAGASFGVYALQAAQIAGTTVCAIEPQPHLAEAIRRSARMNGFNNVTVIEAAVSESNGTAELLVHPGGSGSASIQPERRGNVATSLQVPTITLDHATRGWAPSRVTVLKMDVENAEALALRGGREFLTTASPFIIFEAGASQHQDEVFSILRASGYEEFYDTVSIREGRLVTPGMNRSLINIIAVPPGRRAQDILEG